jgi:Domain of unknown function (DUF4331)
MRRILGVIGVALAAGLVMSASAASASTRGGGKSFVGPADDPFFVDLGAVFDGISIDRPGRPTT